MPDFDPSEESIVVASASRSSARPTGSAAASTPGCWSGDRYEVAASLWAASHGLVSLELRGHKPETLGGDDPYERTVAAMIRGFSP